MPTSLRFIYTGTLKYGLMPKNVRNEHIVFTNQNDVKKIRDIEPTDLFFKYCFDLVPGE